MATIKKVNCFGLQYAPDQWVCKPMMGINRLYHIHSGTGGCYHNGTHYTFLAGHLYFIPFTRHFEPYSDPADPILHTYADFERIPPIPCDRILSADPAADELAMAALAVFDAGGRQVGHLHGADLQRAENESLWRLCAESILYLTSFIAKENGILEIRDPVVLKVLETLHASIGEPLSVSQLAADCYLSSDSLIRRFSKAVGMTPYAYFKELRLHTALCLRAEGMDLATIAIKTGYADPSSLLHAMSKRNT